MICRGLVASLNGVWNHPDDLIGSHQPPCLGNSVLPSLFCSRRQPQRVWKPIG